MHPDPVSVVICAYTLERWDDVQAAVASVRAQEPPPHEVLVVVDHNDELARRLRASVPAGVRVLGNVGAPGLSAARNTGVEAASGGIVAFLDDDARAEPGWLAELAAPFAAPDVVAVGGTIRPAWDTRRPRWFPEELDWIVGATYRGLPTELAEVRNPIGASMAVRRDALLAAGGFHAGVGRARRLPVGGEETELSIRLRRLHPDARVLFAPASVVRHRVPAARARLRYAFVRAFAEGITKARVTRLQGAGAGLRTERSYLARTLPRAVVSGLAETVRRRRADGALRAAAIVAVVGATGAGFVGTLLADRAGSRLASSRLAASRRSRRVHPSDGLRILQVTPRFAPLSGGVETHTLEVARRLASRGHRVEVVTTDATGDLERQATVQGVDVTRVPAWPRGRDWYMAPGILPIVGRRRWDVVHLQGVHTFVPPIAALAAILARTPFVVTFHSGGHSSSVRSALRPLQWRLEAPLLRRAAALVGVSRFEADRFSRELAIPRTRFTVIPNGSELPEPAAAPPPDASPDASPEAPDGTLIVSVGRLERYKGHHRILAAMPAILERCPDARLRIAGSGPYEAELRDLAARLGVEERVAIGPVPRDDLAAVLARAALVVLLSDYEAHPLAVMEALAQRRRVLVADTSGLSELAEQGLVRAIDVATPPAGVAEAVLQELTAPPPAEPARLPTWDDTVDALESLYRRVAS